MAGKTTLTYTLALPTKFILIPRADVVQNSRKFTRMPSLYVLVSLDRFTSSSHSMLLYYYNLVMASILNGDKVFDVV